MNNLSKEEQTAVLVTVYKQGPKYLEKYLKNMQTGEKRDIRPGEGVSIIKYWKEINMVLDGKFFFIPHF